MGRHPELLARGCRPTIELTVSIERPRYSFPEVIRPIRILEPTMLLGVVAGSSQIAIDEAGDDLLAPNCFHRRPPDHQLSAVVMRGPVDRSGSDLRLENWGNWLCFMGQSALHPLELGCIQRRHMDHA